MRNHALINVNVCFRPRGGDLWWRAQRELWLQHRFVIPTCSYSFSSLIPVGRLPAFYTWFIPKIHRILLSYSSAVKLQCFWSHFLCRSCFDTQIRMRWSMMTWSLARRVAAARWTTAGAPASSKAMMRPATARVTQRTGCPTPSWEESHLRGKLMCVDHHPPVSLPIKQPTNRTVSLGLCWSLCYLKFIIHLGVRCRIDSPFPWHERETASFTLYWNVLALNSASLCFQWILQAKKVFWYFITSRNKSILRSQKLQKGWTIPPKWKSPCTK